MSIQLLKEDGGYILQENGSFILLENISFALNTASYLLSGSPVSFIYKRFFIIATGIYNLTGQSIRIGLNGIFTRWYNLTKNISTWANSNKHISIWINKDKTL